MSEERQRGSGCLASIAALATTFLIMWLAWRVGQLQWEVNNLNARLDALYEQHPQPIEDPEKR